MGNDDDKTRSNISGNKRKASNTNSSTSNRQHRCGNCEACRAPDCGQCEQCLRKIKFGGDGKLKQACIQRRCHAIHGPSPTNITSSNSTPRNSSSRVATVGSSGRSNRPSAFFDWPDEKDMTDTPEDQNNIFNVQKGTLEATTSVTSSSNGNGWNYKPPTLLDDNDIFPMTSSILNQRAKLPRLPQTVLTKSTTFSTAGAGRTRRVLYHGRARNKENTIKRQKKSPQKPLHLYGLPIPSAPRNICAACATMGDPDDVILLCDGENCGREYHMKCCVPEIREVPKGKFFCIDCHPKGATASLEQYFDAHDEHKAEWMKQRQGRKHSISMDDGFLLGIEYAEHRLMEDVKAFEKYQEEENDGKEEEGEKEEGDTQTRDSKRTSKVRVPFSEVWHLHQEDDRAKHFVGKSIRLYCPIGDDYHNGRILDARKPTAVTFENIEGSRDVRSRLCPTAATTSLDIDDTEVLVKFPAGMDNRKTSLTVWMRLEEHCVALMTRIAWGRLKGHCFIREVKAMKQQSNFFSDDTVSSGSPSPKKKSHKRKSSTPPIADLWVPIRVWQRTAPEVIPISHLLHEDKGEIQFHVLESDGRTNRRKTPNPPLYALGQSIRGDENYQLLNIEADIADSPPPPFDAFAMIDCGLSTPSIDLPPDLIRQLQLLTSLARTELCERERVRKWWKLPLTNPVHPMALTSRDEGALGALEFSTGREFQEESCAEGTTVAGRDEVGINGTNGVHGKRSLSHVTADEDEAEDIELCPLITHGLDRSYILEALSNRIGVDKSKDVGSSLVCELMMDSVSTAVHGITEQHKNLVHDERKDEQGGVPLVNYVANDRKVETS